MTKSGFKSDVGILIGHGVIKGLCLEAKESVTLLPMILTQCSAGVQIRRLVQ